MRNREDTFMQGASRSHGKEDEISFQIRSLQTLRGHEQPVTCVRFSPLGFPLASASGNEIRLWEQNEDQGYSLQQVVKVNAYKLAFSSDGSLMASVGGSGNIPASISLWTAQGISLAPLLDQGIDLIFIPDSPYLLIGDRYGHLRVWDVTEQKLLSEFASIPDLLHLAYHDPVRELAITPDGKRLAFCCPSKRGAVQICTVQPEAAGSAAMVSWVDALVDRQVFVSALAFSPDQQVLAIAARDLLFFDAQTLLPTGLCQCPSAQDSVIQIAFSPDGQYIAGASKLGTVCIWNVATRQPAVSFEAHTTFPLHYLSSLIGSIDWSTDAMLIATSGTAYWEGEKIEQGQRFLQADDFTVKLWQCKWKRQLRK